MVFLLLPEQVLTVGEDLIKIVGIAVVAGYAGRMMIAQATRQLLRQVEDAEEKAEKAIRTFDIEDKALTLSRRHLEGETVPVEELKEAIKKASAVGKVFIFDKASDVWGRVPRR